MLLRRSWLLLVLLLWLPPCAAAFELSPEDREKLEQAESPYKVTPEREADLRALLAPFDLDARLPGDFVLDGMGIDRHFVRLIVKKGTQEAALYLLPPVVAVDGTLETPSFRLLAEGQGAEEAIAALSAAIIKNDDGKFWPEPEAASGAPGRRVPVVARKIHATELIGDFFVILFIIALIVGIPGFGGAFKERSIAWWWALVGVLAYAFAVRIVVALVVHGDDPSVTWSPSSEMAHSSVAWYLGTLGRFVSVSTGLVAMVNLVLATLTVGALFLTVSFLVPGLWPAVIAGLVAASMPMHVALASSITVMVPFVFFLSGALLCSVVYVRTRGPKVYWLGTAFFLFAVFARPEGLVLAVPVFLVVPLLAERESWRRIHFIGPAAAQLAILVVRGLTIGSGPDAVDPFLSWQMDLATLHSNVGNWVLGFGRVSFAAMLFWAMGVAARPWRKEPAIAVLMGAWLLLGIAVYYHVDMTTSYQGGRVALYFLVPMAWLAGHGAAFLAGLKHAQRWWLMTLLLLWLLFSPLIHRTAIDRDFKATYRQNFLIEA